jgi:hypothetical protein
MARKPRHLGGRPPRDPAGKAAGDLLRIRVTEAEKAAYEMAAYLRDASVSDWARDLLNAAARKAS